MKTLVVFDFDDTLFKSDASVLVNRTDGLSRRISTKEYASYTPSNDEKLDFSEFHSYPKNPRPIVAMTQRLKNSIHKYGMQNVIILSARSTSKPIEQVLQDFSLPNIQVIALNSSDPQMKAKFTVATVKEENYDAVKVFEDNIKNIDAIYEMLPKLVKRNSEMYQIIEKDDSTSGVIRRY